MEATLSRPAEITHRPRVAQRGPHLLGPGIAFAALTIGTSFVGAWVPRPTDTAAVALGYYRDHATAVGVNGLLLFGSSVPLAIWSAVAYRRLRQLGVTAPGTAIGFAGGLLASVGLALSGMINWVASRVGDIADPALARTLSELAFAAGGPGFVVPLGLLVAGVSVPSLILRFVPRAVSAAGLVIAVICELATLSLLIPAVDPALPIGRFGGGVLWLLAVSALLPATRARGTARS